MRHLRYWQMFNRTSLCPMPLLLQSLICLWTRSWEFMFQKAIWNFCLKNMYPIWDIYSIKLQFEMHILLSEFISPPVSTWLLQSNQLHGAIDKYNCISWDKYTSVFLHLSWSTKGFGTRGEKLDLLVVFISTSMTHAFTALSPYVNVIDKTKSVMKCHTNALNCPWIQRFISRFIRVKRITLKSAINGRFSYSN